MLGSQFDAFQTFDPREPVPDITPSVEEPLLRRRLSDLDFVERSFARGRPAASPSRQHAHNVASALRLMASSQLAAFDVAQEPLSVRERYGDTPFGRGCLAARRLIDVGVRCVEVTLSGWDSHANNHEIHRNLLSILDPALAALLADLRERGLAERTLVVCRGEFGRTPSINRLEGRDHWPYGFTTLLSGGGIRPGQVVGETDPTGGREVHQRHDVPDLHATILTALGIDPTHEELAPIGRPIKFSEGQAITQLLG